MSDYAPSAILNFKFATILDAVPTTLAGTPVVSVYKNNSTTQSVAGVTLSVDFDSITGCHNVKVDTSADGTFYAAGNTFQLVVTAGTVGGNSLVGFVVDGFSLDMEPALAVLGTPAGASVSADIAAVKSDTGTTLTDAVAIKAKTDNLPSSPAAVGDIPTATQNADALLKRDWTSVTGEAARSVLNALRFIRNGFSTSGTTLSVLKEDDSTVAYTRTVTTDPSAEPIVGVD